MDLSKVIRTIPDFPEKGIIFRDTTPVFHNPDALRDSVDQLADLVSDLEFDFVAGPESRGFMFGVPVAYKLKKGFIPIRKAGKLPCETVSCAYSLEYGQAVIEMHKDAIKPGDRVVVVDDLLATGGTCKALASLVEQLGGSIVKMAFLIELEALKGKKALEQYDICSILKY